MERDRFQTLPKQCLILYSAVLYSGGREHEDQRPKQCKHKWDQSLWMTCTQSFWRLRITASALFTWHAVLRLKSSRLWAVFSDEASTPQTAPSHISRQHTTCNVTAGMSGFSAWFVPKAASCYCLYPRWVNVSQTSSPGVDTGRHRAHMKIKTVLQQRGESEVKCFREE